MYSGTYKCCEARQTKEVFSPGKHEEKTPVLPWTTKACVNLLKVDPEWIRRKRLKDFALITTHLAKAEIKIIWVETNGAFDSRNKDTSHLRKFLWTGETTILYWVEKSKTNVTSIKKIMFKITSVMWKKLQGKIKWSCSQQVPESWLNPKNP